MFYNPVSQYCVVAWNDNKRVVLASDFIGLEPQLEIRRWDKKGHIYEEVHQPAIVKVYNTFMGGVDLADMLAAMHGVSFRWNKWFMRIFCRLLDTSVTNAWLVYRSQVKTSNREVNLYNKNYK